MNKKHIQTNKQKITKRKMTNRSVKHFQQHSLWRDVGVPQKMQEENLDKLLCQGTNSSPKKKKNERMS